MAQVSSIDSIQDEIIDEFSFFDNWEDKYGYLIDLGKGLKPLDSTKKVDENIIKGCQSLVWVSTDYEKDKVLIEGDSDSAIVKGLVSLMIRVFSGHKADDILNTDLGFLREIGLEQHLSPTRSNGLASMIKQIKMNALAYRAKFNS